MLPSVIENARRLPSLSVALNFTTSVPMETPSLTCATGEPGTKVGALSLVFITSILTKHVVDLDGVPWSVAIDKRKNVNVNFLNIG